MRNTPIHSAERPSRLSRVAVILSTLGVALISAWVFAPMLLANHTATAPVVAKARTVAQVPTVAPPPTPVAAIAAPAVAPPQEEATASVPAPGVAAATPSRFDTPSLAAWPSETASEPPTDTGAVRVAATAPDAPDEFVPLPRKRPKLAIAGRLIPLPRPRPDTEIDGPAVEQSAFERQVDRMR